MRLAHVLILVGLAIGPALSAQERFSQHFRLAAPNAAAEAYLDADQLEVVDQTGRSTVYSRDARFDSEDARWLGFFSRSLNQVIRWPVAGSGNMQIGDLQRGSVRYRTSQMTIQSLDRAAARPVLPPPVADPQTNPLAGQVPPPFPQPPADPQLGAGDFVDSLEGTAPNAIFDSVYQGQAASSQMLQLATFDPRGLPLYLTRDRLTSLSLSRNPVADSNWWVVPAGHGYVRVQHYQDGRIAALSAARGQTLALAAVSPDPGQLWRVASIAGSRQRFVLESARYSGLCMASHGGQLLLQPITYAPTQWWVPLAAPLLATYEPFWRTVRQEVQVNAALAPAQLGLVNSHRTALTVLLADQRQPGQVQQLRIEPGQTATVTIDRDAGATLVESYEIRSPSGVWDRQQFTTVIPPRVLYDLSVYEDFLQSIAIDRTGKSPNPIEDVNYMPKSVGWLPIPPGAALPQSSQMDVMAQARAANNPGAVRRMDPKQFEYKPTSPVEAILDEFKSVPRKSF